MISKIIGDTEGVPKTLGYKIIKGLITLADEEEVCTKPKWAYRFALVVRGANIEKCQEGACKDSGYAYCFARDIPGADIEKCQEAVCLLGIFLGWIKRNARKLHVKILEWHIILPIIFPGRQCRQIYEGTEYAF